MSIFSASWGRGNDVIVIGYFYNAVLCIIELPFNFVAGAEAVVVCVMLTEVLLNSTIII
jgi:hypothetical protein